MYSQLNLIHNIIAIIILIIIITIDPPFRMKVHNTLLKSDVTRPDHVVRCRGSQECGSRFVKFACKFH